MIAGSSGRKQRDVVTSGNSGQVLTQSFGFGDEVGATLGAEHTMYEITGERVWHAVNLRRCRTFGGDGLHNTL